MDLGRITHPAEKDFERIKKYERAFEFLSDPHAHNFNPEPLNHSRDSSPTDDNKHEDAQNSKSGYKVYVDDNFHYQDEDERYLLGTFDTCESAIAACKKIVDGFLDKKFAEGEGPEELWDSYTSFGEDPFIRVSGGQKPCKFSAWTYAKERI